jgi:hypothetical protein
LLSSSNAPSSPQAERHRNRLDPLSNWVISEHSIFSEIN